MKKGTLLNQPISAVIAGLGHTDTLVIADAGLPIPPETQRIDLALAQGIPAFLDVLRVVMSEMQVERALVAQELVDGNPEYLAQIKALLDDVPVGAVPHETFKSQTRTAHAIIRTGEFTPYANIILSAGVVF
ncbi:MAG: D-ribose pyranase [Chloroflexi bacterium]|nr:MAG: D-ribose pyranase [Chloroflexota bacterium]